MPWPAFFSSTDPFRVFIRQVENAFGGTGATLSFIIEWSSTTAGQITPDSVLDLLAHETVHEYALLDGKASDAQGAEPETAWYDEGVANYYAALATFYGSSASPAERDFLRWQLNNYAQSYYTSPVVGMPWSDVLKHYWDSLHITRVSYNRGFILFAAVNGKIRAATRGARSVDDVVLELYRRRVAGEPNGLAEWHALVGDLIGVQAEQDLYETLMSGDLIVPPAGCLASLGLQMVRKDAEVFELGFDPNSLRSNAMRISGLVKGSRAERAGVREGDEVVQSWMAWGAADSLDGMMNMTVRRESGDSVIQWWPRSYEKTETWIWVEDQRSEEL